MMKIFSDKGPIIAISSGKVEKSALGIVRVSGCNDLTWLSQLTKKKIDKFEDRKVIFSRFYGKDDQILDEGVFFVMHGKSSFTGETTVEFNLHGNPLILENFVEDVATRFGFKEAAPGEFSYRALKNGKLNITQVEGLDVLLNTNSRFGLSQGTKLLNNDLYEKYKELRDSFLNIKASIEIAIDFSEDVGEDEIQEKLLRDANKFKFLIETLRNRAKINSDQLLNPSIALVGKTNAGKSTLFNKFVGMDRAIVTDIHGTTRDFISETVTINGNKFQLVDTAGLRQSEDRVEAIGIERSLEIQRKSFYKALVVNVFQETVDLPFNLSWDAIIFTHSDCEGFLERLSEFLQKIKVDEFELFLSEENGIFLFNSDDVGPIEPGKKCGPMGAVLGGSIGPGKENGPMGAELGGSIGPGKKSGPMGAELGGSIGPAIKNGPIGAFGIKPDFFDRVFIKFQSLTNDEPLAVKRHSNVILKVYDTFDEFYQILCNSNDLGVFSSYVNSIERDLDELIGIISPQEVLDHIFENFCIGK